MPGRTVVFGAQYRFSFNAKENDNEVKGPGNQQDYGLRIYDPRLAKFLSVDPLSASFPWYTPYQFAGNGPIANIDLDGAEPKPAIRGTQEGQQQTTEEDTYNLRGDWTGHKKETWNWHAGGLGTGKYASQRDALGNVTSRTEILSEAGWYNREGYLNVLASSSAARQLAGDAGYSRWVHPGLGGSESLSKFVGEGLGVNAASYLNAAAWKVGSQANFMASGYTEPSSFNVEDMLLAGVMLKQGIKLLGSLGSTVVNRGSKFLKFGGDGAVVHFGKHADQIMKVTGKTAYNLKNYVDDANWIIQNGTYSSKLNGYYHYMGNATKGESLFGFVGLKNGGSTISTFHIKTATQLGLK